jgi:hypothetical protein
MILKHPAYVQFQVQQRLLALTKNEDQDIAAAASMVLSQMQGAGIMGPQGGGTGAGTQGRPQAPRRPEQLTGMPTPGGGPTRQAEGGAPPGQEFGDVLQSITEMAPGMTPGGGRV